MAALKSIELEVQGAKDLALINNADDSVWLVVPLRWWDLATLLFWFFVPTDKKANVSLAFHGSAKKVKFKAVRVATRFVRVRGM